MKSYSVQSRVIPCVSNAIIAAFPKKTRGGNGLIYSAFLFALFAILFGAAIQPAAAQSAPQPVSLAVGADGLNRLLWNNPDGYGDAALWRINADASATPFTFGPFAGWTPTAVAVGQNNAPRLLWNHTNGTISLWNVAEGSGSFTAQQYGPYPGWTAIALGVGGNNAPRILWNHTNGTMSLWNVNIDGTFTSQQSGPYPGWTASFLAVGPNNVARILWTNTNGMVSLWNVNTDGTFTSQQYGAFTGWSPVSLAVDNTNAARILWSHAPEGSVSLWTVAPDNTYSSQNYTPPAGYTAKRLSAGPAGSISLLWAKPDGTAQIWVINADGTIKSQTTYPSVFSVTVTPNPVGGGLSATGTVTLNTPALPGGMSVALSSDNALATVPASVVVPAGATSATFTVTTSNLSAPGSATANISAAFGGVTQTTALSITYTVTGPVTGVYRLTTRGQQGMALDVLNFGTVSGTAVQIANAGQTCNQQWLVEKQTDGTYKIHPYSGVNSNQELDDNNGSIATGNKVTTYQDNGNAAQRWYFLSVGGGYYRIIPKNAGLSSNQTLDMSGGESATAGSTTAIYPYYGGSNQVFRLDPPGPAQPTPGIYRISTRGNPTLSLDVVGFGNTDGTNVQLYTANQTSNQQWLVQTTGGNLYSIAAYSAENSMQMLDDAGGITTNGNKVTTFTDNGTPNQRWYFQDIGGGCSRIIPSSAGAASGQTLDVRNGNNAKLGDTLNIYQYYGGDNQVFKLSDPGPFQLLVNPKKGIGGKEWAGWGLHNSWYYNWGAPEPTDAPPGTEFVPMEWSYYGGDNTSWLNSMKAQPGVKNFLAFNEPDHTDQANLSVATALTGYQYMSNLGIPIGSPGCADDNDQWFSDFMAGVTANNYRMDFIAVHCYIRDPNAFLSYIDNLHNRYWQHPLWITEFAPADWSGTNPVSVAEAENFMKIVVPGLNSRWYVARYAWYTGAEPGGTWTLSSAGLVWSSGGLTDIGLLYGRM